MKINENDAVFFFPGPYSLIAAYSQGFCYARIVRAYTTFPSGVVTASIRGRDAHGVDFELPRVEVLSTLPTVDRATCFAIPIPEEGCEIGDGLVPPRMPAEIVNELLDTAAFANPAPFIGFYPTASRFVGQGGEAGGAGATADFTTFEEAAPIPQSAWEGVQTITGAVALGLLDEPTDAEKQAATCLDRSNRQVMASEAESAANTDSESCLEESTA